MAGKLEFQEKLRGILALAQEQGKRISLEETEKFFEEAQLSQEQMELVCRYLVEQGIEVTGYVPAGGRIQEASDEEEQLSEEEQRYLDSYQNDIEGVKAAGNERLAYYLEKVVEEARKLPRSEVFLGDLIQEGNMRLVTCMDEAEEGKEREDEILEAVRAAMREASAVQSERKRQDRQMVEKVSRLEAAIKELTEEEGRTVSLEEAAVYLGISGEEAAAIYRLMGEEE